jgi:hypothetical protein
MLPDLRLSDVECQFGGQSRFKDKQPCPTAGITGPWSHSPVFSPGTGSMLVYEDRYWLDRGDLEHVSNRIYISY